MYEYFVFSNVFYFISLGMIDNPEFFSCHLDVGFELFVIAQNLVDFEQLIAKCKVQIEKCKTKEKIYHNDY